jgi:ketosteroid isomerase-like protein
MQMKRVLGLLLLLATTCFAREPSPDEQQVWNLEKSYWEYVKTNDLEKYRSLWHEDFVGWPSISASPVRKDHITDWITAQTSQGLALKSFELEQLANQVTGDIAVTHYRIKTSWAGAQPKDDAKTQVTRITHTWLRRNGTWQIIGGMSCPVNAQGK